MNKHWQSLSRQLGWQGMLGCGLLVAAYLFYLFVLGPLEQRAELERAEASAWQQNLSMGARGAMPQSSAAMLEKFYAFFPGDRLVTDKLAIIYRQAEANALELRKGEYKPVEEEGGGLRRYQISLPVRGTYPQIQAFVMQVLEKIPTVSLDRVLLSREHTDDPYVDAEIQFTLYMRLQGAAP